MNGDIEDWRRRNMMSTPRASEYYETRMERGVDMRNNTLQAPIDYWASRRPFNDPYQSQYHKPTLNKILEDIESTSVTKVKQDTELAIVKADKEVNIKLLNI